MPKYFDLLKSCKIYQNSDYSKAQREVSKIVQNKFLYELNYGKHKTPYRSKVSCGMGSKSDMWWFALFNREFYDDFLKITDQRKVSASRGYYLVYLFSDDMDTIFLSLNQGAKNISKAKNSLNKQQMLTVNNEFRKHLTLNNPNYIFDISNQLSVNQKQYSARDYEIGSIIAIKYDLKGNVIPDKQFADDLQDMIRRYEELTKYITNNNYINTGEFTACLKEGILVNNNSSNINLEDLRIDFEEENKYLSEEKNGSTLTDEQLNQEDNRKPSYNDNHSTRANTNAGIAKRVLKDKDYLCEIEPTHISFLNLKGHKYMEPHHLVPMKFQKEFGDYNLDRSANIVCLCSNCHNAIHYGNVEEKISRLSNLYEGSLMKDILKEKFNISTFSDFFTKFYDV